jgi:phthiocerol/phenolphthiocerol synthesis type-I polyketide synthase C
LPEREAPLVFGINSFGFGGTNAHAVLREYRPAPPAAKVLVAAAGPAEKILLLSGQNEGALNDTARDYAVWLRGQDADDWDNICATAALCRTQHGHRLALAATSPDEAAAKLDLFRAGEPAAALATGRAGAAPARVAFVYSGNGPQWWAMGRELLDASPVFRAEMAAVDALFAARAGWSVIEELRRPEQESRMALTEVAQPTLFALQLGLTAMLREAGIVPAAVFGHSVGEVAASFASGALSREQATDVIFHRSAMQARTAGQGKMVALGIGLGEARAAIEPFGGALELAAINSPRAVTIAGNADALAILRDRLTEVGKFARMLPLNYAFHSRAMDPIREELLDRLDGLAPSETSVPFISTVEGYSIDGAALKAPYWWRNIRAPVRFADAVMHAIRDRGIRNFIEIGPHPVLRDYVLQTARASDVPVLTIQTLRRPAADRPEPEAAAMWQAICTCHAHGAGHPEALFERPARPASLPAYPWQRVRHWRGAVPLPETASPTQREHPLLGWRSPGTVGVWQNVVDTTLLPFLADHVVQGAVLFPATGYIELGLAAARLVLGDGPLALENVDILRPLTVAARPMPALHCALDIADGTWEIRSRPELHGESSTTHVRGRLTRADRATKGGADLHAMRAKLPDFVDGAAHYEDARRRGLAYGPAFQGVRAVWMSPSDALPRTALAEISLPALDAAALADYRAHPALLDCCLQGLITLLGRTEKPRCAFIPVQVERIRSFAPLPAELICRLTVTRESERSGSAEIEVFDTEGTLLLTMSGARFRKMDFGAATGALVTEGWRLDPSGAGWSTEPVALPAPPRIAAPLARGLPALAETHGRAVYHADVGPRLDALVGAYAVHAVHELAAGEATFMLPQLQRRSRVDATQVELLARLVAMAVEDGWLVRAGGALVWTADRALPDTPRMWRELLLDHPTYGAELVLAARHGERLIPRLRGELPASDGVDSATEQLYEAAPFRAMAASVVAATVRALVAEWPTGRPIRVLELGGASGGLTAHLLPILPAERTEYVFSDTSQPVLDRASLRFAGVHCLRTALFDVDADPAAQGLPLGAFDVILAAEALHAAPDTAAALRHAGTMLAPGGWLIRIERGGSRLEDLLFASGTPAPALRLIDNSAGVDEALRTAGFDSLVRIAEPPYAGRQPEQSVTITQRVAGGLPGVAHQSAEPTRRWLLLAGGADLAFAEAVSAHLQDRGQSVTTMVLSAAAAEAVVAGPDMAAACDEGADEIVHLAGLVHKGGDAPEAMLALQDLRCLSAINLVQAVKSLEGGYKPRLHLVTSGALAGPADTASIDPAQAPLWGFGRVLANEHPDFSTRMVDLHAPLDGALAAQLTDELLRADAETEVLLTAGQRFVNRMQPATITQLAALSAPAANGAELPFRLDLAATRRHRLTVFARDRHAGARARAGDAARACRRAEFSRRALGDGHAAGGSRGERFCRCHDRHGVRGRSGFAWRRSRRSRCRPPRGGLRSLDLRKPRRDGSGRRRAPADRTGFCRGGHDSDHVPDSVLCAGPSCAPAPRRKRADPRRGRRRRPGRAADRQAARCDRVRQRGLGGETARAATARRGSRAKLALARVRRRDHENHRWSRRGRGAELAGR